MDTSMKKVNYTLFCRKSAQKGFTLIELIIYVGIFSILIGVMSAMFGSILDVQLESEATSSVDQDGRYLLSKLTYDFKTINPTLNLATPDKITTPANPGDTSPTLQIRVNSVDYVYSLNSSNNLQVQNVSTGEMNVLNSVGTSVTGLSFQRVGSGGSNDTIRVNFTVQSRTLRTTGYESRSFQTTLARQ
jgi:prepilin-type N-terminal cleavage/methylation domain-containing protein